MEELLVYGANVLLLKQKSPFRKTIFDLIMTWCGDTLVGVDNPAKNERENRFPQFTT